MPAAILPLLLVLAAPPATTEENPANLAGWYNLRPVLPNCSAPTFDPPFVQKVKGSEAVYAQRLHFTRLTKPPRGFTITFMRNTDIRKRYSAETLKALDDPPQEMRIDNWTAWVWDGQQRVVVPLDADKAVILENDRASNKIPLVDCARRLDLKSIRDALARPPRAELTLTVETFRILRKGDPVHAIADWCGPAVQTERFEFMEKPKTEWRYDLSDGSAIVVAGRLGIETITIEWGDGIIEDVLK